MFRTSWIFLSGMRSKSMRLRRSRSVFWTRRCRRKIERWKGVWNLMLQPRIGAALALGGMGALCALQSPAPALGQGCVATGASGIMFGSPSLGPHGAVGEGGSPAGGRSMEAGAPTRWQAAIGYRYFRSHRHFVGSAEQHHREEEGSEFINNNHLIDLSLTRVLARRWTATIGLPIFVASRSIALRQGGPVSPVVGRGVTRAQGIGDLRLVANRWMLDPAKHGSFNVALGLGLKLPTGEADAVDDHRAANGSSVKRSVDQSIQPGDGGVGVILGLQAFRALSGRLTLFADGTYLVNPQGNNGVATARFRRSEGTMSVADQYLARLGASAPIWPRAGLSTNLAARLEGVPVEDLLGPSDGFRRPGLTASIEPGLSWTWKRLTTTLSVPVAFHRERQQSVTDRADGSHGDAAFADYSIFVGQSVRF